MWNIAGHEIGLAGGPYMDDHGDPMTAVHCHRCPDGTDKGWMLWRCPDELGEPAPAQPALAAIADHVRADGCAVPEDVAAAALMLSALNGAIESGLDMLADQFPTPPETR